MLGAPQPTVHRWLAEYEVTTSNIHVDKTSSKRGPKPKAKKRKNKTALTADDRTDIANRVKKDESQAQAVVSVILGVDQSQVSRWFGK